MEKTAGKKTARKKPVDKATQKGQAGGYGQAAVKVAEGRGNALVVARPLSEAGG